MKIYQVCANLEDNVRGDQFIREFEFYLDYDKAIKRKLELKKKWNEYKHITTSAFYIRTLEVIE